MGGAGVNVVDVTVTDPRLTTELLITREALHRSYAEMLLDGLRRGRPEYRAFWGLVEADRRGDIEGYAIALVQLRHWYEGDGDGGSVVGLALNEWATSITAAVRHVIRQLPPDWTPAWRDGGEGSAG